MNSVNIIQLFLVLLELSFLFFIEWSGLKIAWSFMITSNLFNFITSTSTCRKLRYLFRHTSQFNYLVISIFWIIPYKLASRNPVCFEDFFLEGGGSQFQTDSLFLNKITFENKRYMLDYINVWQRDCLYFIKIKILPNTCCYSVVAYM